MANQNENTPSMESKLMTEMRRANRKRNIMLVFLAAGLLAVLALMLATGDEPKLLPIASVISAFVLVVIGMVLALSSVRPNGRKNRGTNAVSSIVIPYLIIYMSLGGEAKAAEAAMAAPFGTIVRHVVTEDSVMHMTAQKDPKLAKDVRVKGSLLVSDMSTNVFLVTIDGTYRVVSHDDESGLVVLASADGQVYEAHPDFVLFGIIVRVVLLVIMAVVAYVAAKKAMNIVSNYQNQLTNKYYNALTLASMPLGGTAAFLGIDRSGLLAGRHTDTEGLLVRSAMQLPSGSSIVFSNLDCQQYTWDLTMTSTNITDWAGNRIAYVWSVAVGPSDAYVVSAGGSVSPVGYKTGTNLVRMSIEAEPQVTMVVTAMNVRATAATATIIGYWHDKVTLLTRARADQNGQVVSWVSDDGSESASPPTSWILPKDPVASSKFLQAQVGVSP